MKNSETLGEYDVSKPRPRKEWLRIFGNGHWEAFTQLGIEISEIERAASCWATQLVGVEKAWLCWNVEPAWCLIQQKLVREVGWTPVVGFDPRVGPPPLIDGAICIDFNAQFKLPTMWMHFPMEFIFLFCERMAFWHSDLLIRRDTMAKLAGLFAGLPDGAAVSVAPKEGNLAFLYPKQRRYWELVGCSTRGASRSQFENGCGWWMDFWQHPSNTEKTKAERIGFYYDHGTGVRYWHRHCKGDMRLIPEKLVAEGHCTRIGKKDYKTISPNDSRRNLALDLPANFDLQLICKKLGLLDLYS